MTVNAYTELTLALEPVLSEVYALFYLILTTINAVGTI